MDWQWFARLLELGERDLGFVAMALRAVIVFLLVLLIVRVGSRRFLSKLSPFDMLVGIMIGSIASRAITGNSTFWPSLGSIAALVFLHWLFGFVSFHTDGVGFWLKGRPRRLVKDGKLQMQEMGRSHITRRDLEECARSSGVTGGVEQICDAWLERDGSISVSRKSGAFEREVEGG